MKMELTSFPLLAFISVSCEIWYDIKVSIFSRKDNFEFLKVYQRKQA